MEQNELKPGTALLTKDGQVIGNAVVTKVFEGAVIPTWQIETDFGALIVCTEGEIRDKFYLGEVKDLAEWRGAHIAAVLKANGYSRLAKQENRELAQIVFQRCAEENKAEAEKMLADAKAQKKAKKSVSKVKTEKLSSKSTSALFRARQSRTEKTVREFPKGKNIVDRVFAARGQATK